MEARLIEPAQAEPEWVKRLNDLNDEIKTASAEIDKAEKDAGIPALRKQIKAAQDKLDKIVDEIGPTLLYTEIDAISKKPMNKVGNIKILRGQNTTRSPRVADLARDYPEETAQVTEHIFRIGKAEELLGKEVVDSYCDRVITNTYKAVIIKKPAGPKTMVIEQEKGHSDRPTKKVGGKISGGKRRVDAKTL